MTAKFRVFASCDIGESIELLRKRGYDVEVYPKPEAPPKSLIVEKVKSGIDGLITTLRDPIDAEIFEAGKGHLKVVAQIAVGFDNINRADANRYKIPFTHTADVLTEATAEFAFFMMGALARRLWTAEHLTRDLQWGFWHPYLPFLGDEVTAFSGRKPGSSMYPSMWRWQKGILSACMCRCCGKGRVRPQLIIYSMKRICAR